MNWPDSDHSSGSADSGSDSGLDAVPCATAIDVAVVASDPFVGVPRQPLVLLQQLSPLHCDVPALVPTVSLLLRDEPVVLLSLFAPPRSGTSWDRIRSSFLRVMAPIQKPLPD